MAPGDHIAYLTECADEDERGPVAPALFDCWIESGGEVAEAEEEFSLPLADALAWARQRAARVHVRLFGWDAPEYSAGEKPLPYPPIEQAPPLARRRAQGWEFLDRTGDEEPISWDVVLEAAPAIAAAIGFGGRLTLSGERWRDALAGACELLAVRADGDEGLGQITPGGRWARYTSWPVALIRLEAGTVADAKRAVEGLAAQAAGSAGLESASAFAATAAYPTGSRAARANARLE